MKSSIYHTTFLHYFDKIYQLDDDNVSNIIGVELFVLSFNKAWFAIINSSKKSFRLEEYQEVNTVIHCASNSLLQFLQSLRDLNYRSSFFVEG
jgi:hypothetical protein